MTKTLLAACALLGGATANADVVTFAGYSTGGKPNARQSVKSLLAMGGLLAGRRRR